MVERSVLCYKGTCGHQSDLNLRGSSDPTYTHKPSAIPPKHCGPLLPHPSIAALCLLHLHTAAPTPPHGHCGLEPPTTYTHIGPLRPLHLHTGFSQLIKDHQPCGPCRAMKNCATDSIRRRLYRNAHRNCPTVMPYIAAQP